MASQKKTLISDTGRNQTKKRPKHQHLANNKQLAAHYHPEVIDSGDSESIKLAKSPRDKNPPRKI